MREPRNRATPVLFGIAAFILLFWWRAKCLLFEGFAYTSDLFSFIQMSRSWLEGKPLLYENAFGLNSRYHSFYTVLLLGPLTHFLGAYGLFLATLLLMAAASFAALRSAMPSRSGSWSAGLLMLGLLLGPVSFWIWDDFAYGWHAEILFLPLGVLYAVALMRKRGVRERLLLLLLICLTREEGPVLAFAIHFVVGALQTLSVAPAENGVRRICRDYLWTAWPYLLIFCGLVAWIAVQGGGGASRLAVAFESSRSGSFDWRPLRSWALLLSPFPLVTWLAYRKDWRVALRALACLVMSLLPVLAVTWLASHAYRGPADIHGILWPPRFVLPWTVATAASLATLPSLEQGLGFPGRAVLIALAVAVQPLALAVTRRYSVADRLWPSSSAQSRVPWLGVDEKRLLRCLSDRLPPRSSVAVSWDLFAAFHRHDIVWPDRIANAWSMPSIVICERHQRDDASRTCVSLRRHAFSQGFTWTRLGRLLVGYGPTETPIVSPCILEYRPAGAADHAAGDR
jgi:hypothetical protein